MPGPVNQVHKPKPLGEVLLLNSSQLLEFFFPLSLLIGESWVFPGSWFARERKKGARDYCTGGDELWRSVLWFHCISPSPVHSLHAPQPKPVCATDNGSLRSSKVEHGHVSGFGSEVQQHLLWCLGRGRRDGVGGRVGEMWCAVALCACLNHTWPSSEFRLEGKLDAW